MLDLYRGGQFYWWRKPMQIQLSLLIYYKSDIIIPSKC